MRYKAAELEAIFPLQVGKKMKLSWERQNAVWTNDLSVLRMERVTVPAGTFDTFVVERIERGLGRNTYVGKNVYWRAPALGYSAKFESEVTGGAFRGMSNSWVLEKVELPN
ncbi:MAG: hypothetical protein ACT4P2_15230 [Pseudomonadota bacterium]